MQTKGILDKEHYWIYETFRGYRHAPLFGVQPRTLMVFKNRHAGRMFECVFFMLPLLKRRCVSRQELQTIIDTEYGGNYVVLDADDVYVVGSRYECMPLADYGDVPDR